MSAYRRILVIRLGAMGDIIHTLPAVASMKHGIPRSRITWIVEKRWVPLIDGNPYVDEIVSFDRSSFGAFRAAWHRLRAERFEFAVDFQGLLKSALVATVARPEKIFGFHQSLLRERAAVLFYSHKTPSAAPHMVDQNLDLASAAGAQSLLRVFPLPPGHREGELPDGPFVLTSPLAGWGAKQWPLERFAALGTLLERECGLPLVVNGSSEIRIPNTRPHVSGIPGLIEATRKAAAVIGVDSGPLHIAAAIGKPGVAIFGPTDPARNGPYGASIDVLRSPRARTSHKRTPEPDSSMFEIAPEQVMAALKARLASHAERGAT